METKTIKNFEWYTISDTGIVTNTKTNKILKPQDNGTGYKYINLGAKNRFYIHRLVLETFSPNENSDNLEVDHIDTVRSNNIVTNLRWCTSLENINNPITLENRKGCNAGEKSGMFGIFGKDNPSSIAIIGTNIKDGTIIKFDSLTQAKQEKGYNQSNISTCLNGKTKTAYGYRWTYQL